MALVISEKRASQIVSQIYGFDCEASKLPGDIDLNFKITTKEDKCFILKITDVEGSDGFLDFQTKILAHISSKNLEIQVPKAVADKNGNLVNTIDSETGSIKLRMLSWIDGRLWNKVNPKSSELRYDLGEKAGMLTNSLKNFEHKEGNRNFDWNLANSEWTMDQLHLFSSEEKNIVTHFQKRFSEISEVYKTLPESIVHNDLNDYNILVSEDLKNPKVKGFIDFGDAVYTQTVNNLAILLAYAIMDVEDPLAAACEVIKGYNEAYDFSNNELKCLYSLVAMRLVTTVTKAAINKKENPENKYHIISEKPAWLLLNKWFQVNENFAYYSFRNACGMTAHPLENEFENWAASNKISLTKMFPTIQVETVTVLDMSVGSTLLGNLNEYGDAEISEFKLKQFQKYHPKTLLANGYLETRPFYTTDAFKSEGNNGPQYRTVHLGTDFWVAAQTPVHAPFEGVVKIIHHNDFDKDYGPMLILEHDFNGNIFYSLYGHLTLTSLKILKIGQEIKQGELIAYIGAPNENGNWAPHLHFQLIFDLLGNDANFNGVALPSEKEIWKSICPNPNLIFEEELNPSEEKITDTEIINFRNEHLGLGLSLSYSKPLHIVRGEGVYLIDTDGRKYLDTANNVNHVGHQHPKVVAAGQRQMAVLTTNTRYLHEEIIKYSEALLKKLPEELSVIHIVNSGSEANELALRMAKVVTGKSDFLAVEVGYHGNTNATMEVSSYKFDAKGGSGKPTNTHILPLPDPYRGRHTDEDCGIQYAEYAKNHIENLSKEDRNIAGFIGESMISCGGQIVPPKNYFKEVYKTVRKAGGICIADEVQTGFGRMGKTFWAFELYDVIPDIVTMGKPAGNGHPLAVVACTREVAEKFNTGMEFFNTFGGNPVSCAIGRTVLEVIEEENLQQNALEVGGFLKDELKNLQKSFPIIGDVRGEGLFLGFELNDKNKAPLAEHASYLADRMKDLGILMSTDGPDYNVLKIKPPIVFSKKNAEELIFRLKSVFSEDFMMEY